jgi:hypothetical protein
VDNKVALRSGYFNEHITKGGRKFFGAGAGLKVRFATFDLSYIFPTKENSPLKNTFTLSLSLEFY